MTSDLKARLEEMVREKVKQRRVSGMVGKSHLLIYPLVALDLLQERDALKDELAAAEAKVKALEDADAHALCAQLRASQAREWELRQKLFRSDCNAMGEGWGHTLCAEQRDAAEAQVKALTAELEDADKGLLFWRGIPAYTLDMTYDEAASSKAVEAALARQKARAALKERAMTEAPKCPEPNCGLEMVMTTHPSPFFVPTLVCPRNADAHALCKRVAELEALLKELFSIGEVYISAIESKYAATDFEAWAAKVPSHLKEVPHD